MTAPGRRQRLVLAAAALLGILIVSSCGSGGAAGSGMPDAELTAVADGSSVSAGDLGGPAVINLWATWCVPCRKELPAFQRVQDDLGDQVRIVGVNQGDERGAVTDFLAEIGVDFVQYLDVDGALGDGLRVTGLPATAFVDADGTVTALHSGELTEDELRTMIRDELGIG